MMPHKLLSLLTVGAAAVVLPGSLMFAGFGFLQAHGRSNSSASAAFVSAKSTSAVYDGGSICFEFQTTDDSPIWILLQNRPTAEVPQTVLVSRSPSFDDCFPLRAGSEQETQILQWLNGLKARPQSNEGIRHNMELLAGLISTRTQARPAISEWYFY